MPGGPRGLIFRSKHSNIVILWDSRVLMSIHHLNKFIKPIATGITLLCERILKCISLCMQKTYHKRFPRNSEARASMSHSGVNHEHMTVVITSSRINRVSLYYFEHHYLQEPQNVGHKAVASPCLQEKSAIPMP